jgi:hypothetical protein
MVSPSGFFVDRFCGAPWCSHDPSFNGSSIIVLSASGLRDWGAIYVHDGECVASGATPDCMRHRLRPLTARLAVGVFVAAVVVAEAQLFKLCAHPMAAVSCLQNPHPLCVATPLDYLHWTSFRRCVLQVWQLMAFRSGTAATHHRSCPVHTRLESLKRGQRGTLQS